MSSINNDKNRTFKGIPELYFNSTYDPNLVREQAIENENLLYKKCLQTQREACAMGYTFGKMTDFKIDPAINRKYGLGFRTYTFSVNNTFLNYYSEKNTLRRSTIEGHVYSALDTCRIHTVFKREILFFIENLLYINLKIIPLQKNTIFAIDVGPDGLDEEYLKSKIVAGADWKVLLLPCSNYYLKEATGAAMIDPASTGIKVDAFQGDDLDGCNKPIGRNSYFLFVSDSASRKNLLSMSLTTKTQTVFSITSPEYIAKVKAMPTCKFFIINLPNMGKQVLLGNVRNFQLPLNLRSDCPSTPIPPENLLVMTQDNQYGILSPAVDGNMTLFYPNVYSISGAPADANLSVLVFISEKVSTKFQNPISHYMEYKGSDYIAMCVNDTLPEVLKAYNPEDVKLSAENYLASNAVQKISADQFILNSLMEYLSDDVDRYTKHFSKVDQLDRSLRSFEIDAATTEFTKQPSILNNSEIIQNQTFGFGVNAINFETPVKWFAISKSKEGNCALNVFVDGYFYDENMTITDSKNILAYVYIHEADLKNDSKIMIDCMTDLSSDELVRLKFNAVNADVPFPVTTKYFSDQGLVFYNKATSERIPNSHFVYRAYIGLETYFILTKSLEFTQTKNLEYLVTSHHLSMAEASGFNKKIDYRTTKENIQMTDYAGYTTPVKTNASEVSNPNKQATFTEDMVLVKLDGEPDSICFPVKVSVDGKETLEFSRYIGDLATATDPGPSEATKYTNLTIPTVVPKYDTETPVMYGTAFRGLTMGQYNILGAPYRKFYFKKAPSNNKGEILAGSSMISQPIIGAMPRVARCGANLLIPQFYGTTETVNPAGTANLTVTVNELNQYVVNGTTGSTSELLMFLTSENFTNRSKDFLLVNGKYDVTLSDPSASAATAKHKSILFKMLPMDMQNASTTMTDPIAFYFQNAAVTVDKTTSSGTTEFGIDFSTYGDVQKLQAAMAANSPKAMIYQGVAIFDANTTFTNYIVSPQLNFGKTAAPYENPMMDIHQPSALESSSLGNETNVMPLRYLLHNIGSARDKYYPMLNKIEKYIERFDPVNFVSSDFVKEAITGGTLWKYKISMDLKASNAANPTSLISISDTADDKFMSLATAGNVENELNRYEVRNNGDGSTTLLISVATALNTDMTDLITNALCVLFTRVDPFTTRLIDASVISYGTAIGTTQRVSIIGSPTALLYPKYDAVSSTNIYDTDATYLYTEKVAADPVIPDPQPSEVVYPKMVAPAITFEDGDLVVVKGSSSSIGQSEVSYMAKPYAPPTVLSSVEFVKTMPIVGVLPSIAACNKNLLGPHLTAALDVVPMADGIGNITLTTNADNEFVINGSTTTPVVLPLIYTPLSSMCADHCLIPGSHLYTLSDPTASVPSAKHKTTLLHNTTGAIDQALAETPNGTMAELVTMKSQVVIDNTTESGTTTIEFDPVEIASLQKFETNPASKMLICSIVLSANETFTDYVVRPQLEFGSTKTAYEPPSEMIIYADTRKAIGLRNSVVSPEFMLMSVGNARDIYYPLGAGRIYRSIYRLDGSAEVAAAFVKTIANDGFGTIWTYTLPFSVLPSNKESVTSRISLYHVNDATCMTLASAGTVEETPDRYEVRNNGDGTSKIIISASSLNKAAVEALLSEGITILVTRETPLLQRLTNQEVITYGNFDSTQPMTIIGPTTALKYPVATGTSGADIQYTYDTDATNLYIEKEITAPAALSVTADSANTGTTSLTVSDHKYEAFYIPKRLISPSSTISIERLIAPKDVILAGNLTFDQTPEIRIAAKNASDLNVEIGARSADFHEVLGYQLVNPGESITKYNFKGANSKSRIRVWTLANPADTSHYKKMVLVDPSLYNVEFSPTVGLSDSYVRILFTNTGNGPIWYYAEYLPYKYQLVHRYQDITANASSVIDFQNNLDRPIDCDGYDIYANGVRLNSNHYKVLTASKIKLDASIDPGSSILVFERGHDADVYGNQYIHREIEDTLMDTDRYFAAYMKNL